MKSGTSWASPVITESCCNKINVIFQNTYIFYAERFNVYEENRDLEQAFLGISVKVITIYYKVFNLLNRILPAHRK